MSPSQEQDEEDEWQFGLDDVGEDAVTHEPSIEPGSPDLENVVFVLLGAIGTLILLVGGI